MFLPEESLTCDSCGGRGYEEDLSPCVVCGGWGHFLPSRLTKPIVFERVSVPEFKIPFPDLKAALIVLRQTLSTWAGDAARAPPASSGAPQAASSTATMQVPSLAPDFDMQEILLPQAVVPVAEDIGGGVAANETILAPPLPAGLRAVATGAALNLLQDAIGKERRPLSWVVGDQGVYRPDMTPTREERHDQRISVTNLRSPDDV